ncbi:hypothetical protein PLICRDRAFT_342688 [Plicaturopsis crispa FD-325 SS-3]|uniref:Uncharacterized protein n=1 Tax=Plicaturopsis crispa FD-325 SS-3 TaxID=944288 RepID=A0A0C9T663_PLICR|nr:hypothetical protein PLICRDRAFT_342688 [Plicaturopsis crispa FD-325 SS-3]
MHGGAIATGLASNVCPLLSIALDLPAARSVALLSLLQAHNNSVPASQTSQSESPSLVPQALPEICLVHDPSPVYSIGTGNAFSRGLHPARDSRWIPISLRPDELPAGWPLVRVGPGRYMSGCVSGLSQRGFPHGVGQAIYADAPRIEGAPSHYLMCKTTKRVSHLVLQ